MTSPWSDGESLNAAKMYARITAPLAVVQAQAQPIALLMVRDPTMTSSIADNTQFPINAFLSPSKYTTGNLTVNSNGTTGQTGGIVTITTPGLYIWSATARWPNNPGGSSAYRASCYVLVNGSEPSDDPGRDDRTISPGLGQYNQDAGGEIVLNAGDTLQVALLHNAGVTVNGVLLKTFSLARVA